jgi:hypothetical protein
MKEMDQKKMKVIEKHLKPSLERIIRIRFLMFVRLDETDPPIPRPEINKKNGRQIRESINLYNDWEWKTRFSTIKLENQNDDMNELDFWNIMKTLIIIVKG